MPLCRVDYDRSEIRDYKNEADAGHKYLHLTLIPKKMNLMEQSFAGSLSEYVLNFFPKRNSDMEIDQVFEDALIDAFNNKDLGEVNVDRIEIEIPPTLMTYSSGERQGEVIQENGVDKVYTTVQMICVLKEKADKSGFEPIIGMNRLKSQAARMREQRINSGLWYDATKSFEDQRAAEEANILYPDDEDNTPEQKPQQNQQPQRPQRPQRPTRQ